MSTPLPHVVWPSPGFPAIIQAGSQEFTVVIAAPASPLGSLRQSEGAWTLREREAKTVVPLRVAARTLIGRPDHDPRLRDFARLRLAADRVFYELRLAFAAAPPPRGRRTSVLCDLLCDQQVAGGRAVAVWHGSPRRLRLAFAADLHLAYFWQRLHYEARRAAPQWADALLNPSMLWSRFVGEANALARQGALDLVVLGGDLVEYAHDRRRGAPPEPSKTNWDLLLENLETLQLPSFAVPGNHDYRAFPWRARAYGLKSIGLAGRHTRSLLRSLGLWSGGGLNWSDLDALRTRDELGRPALEEYLSRVAPVTDYAVSLAGTRLVFFSTGADMAPRWRQVEPDRWGLLLRSLRTLWHLPDSAGLTDEQVDWITVAAREAQGAALFGHAPLVHDWNCRPGHEISLARHVGRQSRRRTGADLQLGRSGLRAGVCFWNSGELLCRLAEQELPIALFSGHAHRARNWAIDRPTMRLSPCPRPAEHQAEGAICLLTAPAIGQVGHVGDRWPGYLLAEFHDGRLVSLDRRYLLDRR